MRVLNGTGEPGQASEASTALRAAGFATGGTGDAGRLGVERTEVRHPPGSEDAADLVARWLAGDADVIEDVTVDDITLVTGADWQGLRDGPLPAPEPAETTTTTLPRAPTTIDDETTTTTALGTVSGVTPDDVDCG